MEFLIECQILFKEGNLDGLIYQVHSIIFKKGANISP